MMNIETAQEILAHLTQDQLNALETAHWRYMAFAGVVLHADYETQAKEDQKTFPELLKFDADGKPVTSDQRAADFMVAVTGLSRDWCLAWDEHDFYETHGVTSEEAAQAGHV